MTRPNIDPTQIVSGIEGWDALLRDMLDAMLKKPIPVPQYPDFASLPTATSYDRCMATTVDTNKLWFSDGSTWREVSFV